MNFPLRVSLLVLAIALSGATARRGLAAETVSLFDQGVAASRAADFTKAAEAFRAAVTEQPASGTLENLGVTEWRRGRGGPAILAWEQALWIDPYNKSARDNLDFAKDVLQLEGPNLRWYETASTWLPANAWAWLAWGSLWLAVAAMLLPRVLRWRKAGWQQALAALGLAVFLLSIPAHLGILTRSRIGIVLGANTPLRLTPTAEAESDAALASGDPARKLRTKGDFFFIQTPRGSGWIKREQFGAICPGAE